MADSQCEDASLAHGRPTCIYLAKVEAIIRRHAEASGFPATRITEAKTLFDPTTAAS